MNASFVESGADASRSLTLCDSEPITRLDRIQEPVVSKPYDGEALCTAITATLAGSR